MSSHFAMYSGVSKGAFGDLPFERSPVGAERVGGGGGVAARCPVAARWPAAGAAGAAAPRAPPPPPPPRAGKYTPEKSGGFAAGAAPWPWKIAGATATTHTITSKARNEIAIRCMDSILILPALDYRESFRLPWSRAQ